MLPCRELIMTTMFCLYARGIPDAQRTQNRYSTYSIIAFISADIMIYEHGGAYPVHMIQMKLWPASTGANLIRANITKRRNNFRSHPPSRHRLELKHIQISNRIPGFQHDLTIRSFYNCLRIPRNRVNILKTVEPRSHIQKQGPSFLLLFILQNTWTQRVRLLFHGVSIDILVTFKDIQ